MSIRTRLYFLSALGLFTIAVLVSLLFWSNKIAENNSNYLSQLSELTGAYESMEVESVRFMLDLSPERIEHFKQYEQVFIEHIGELEQTSNETLLAQVSQLENEQKELSNLINQLFEKRQLIGLTPKTGLYGKLRDAVHNVEDVLDQQNDYELLTRMLQLRRNEKDFMLRLDVKYRDQFNKNIATFRQSIERSDAYSSADKQELLSLVDTYQNSFLALIEAEQVVGLNAADGIRKEMAVAEKKATATMAQTEMLILQSQDEERTQVYVVAAVVIALLTLC